MEKILQLIEKKLQALREDAFGSDKAIPLSQIPADAAKAALDGGTKDGNPSDDKAATSDPSPAVSALKPMQKEVIPEKALSFALGFADTGTTPDLNNMEAIVSNDGYIMDGHHRWAARTLLDPTAQVKVSKVDLPADDVVTALNIYTKAKGLKGKPGKGDVKQFATLIPKAIETLITQGTEWWPMKDKTPEEIKKIITDKVGNGDFEKGKAILINNAKKLPTEVHPNAPSRVEMPVIDAKTGDLGAVIKKMAAGELDFKEPFSKDVISKIGKKEPVTENLQEIKRWQKLAGII